MVPRDERAGRRQRPREPEDACRARRRPLRRERPEGVDLGRAPRRLVPVLRAHRPRRAEAQGHQRAHHRHEDAGRRAASVPRALRARLPRLQRGVLHRRGRPDGAPARRAATRAGRITQGSLAHERAMLWIDYAYDVQRARARAASRSATSRGPTAGRSATTPRFRDQVAAFHVDAQALLLMGYRGFSKFMRGRVRARALAAQAVRERDASSGVLLAGRRGARASTRSTCENLGPQMWREGSWATQWLRSFAGTIPGGTSEIQRNIIAERVLGLPRTSTSGVSTRPQGRPDERRRPERLSDAEIDKMRTPLWEQAKAGDRRGRRRRRDRRSSTGPSTQWAGLKDYSINWITSLLTFIGEELGEEAVERALRKTGDEFVAPPPRHRAPTGRSLPAAARAKVIARAMLGEHGRGRGRGGRREDHAVVPVRQRRQADRRRPLRGRPPVPHAARAQRPHVHARRAAGVLRALLGEQRDPAGRVGRDARRASSTRPSARASACVHHVYKDTSRMPADVYVRIGKPPPTGG